MVSRKTITFALVIELERHIEILLLHNDCVIVPQLGGFVAHHVESRFDETDNMMLPPLRTLGFNPKLQLNDSLLAQSYIEANDISYPEAMRRINDDVNELKQHLENEGSYELHGIGTLNRNENGYYEFSPYEAGILTPELYGLCGVELDLQEKKEKPTSNRHAKSAKIINIEEVKEHKAETITISVSTLRNIVAAAAVILAIFIFSIPLTNGDSGDVRMSNIDTGMLKHLMPKDAVKGKPVKLNFKPENTDVKEVVTEEAKAPVEEKLEVQENIEKPAAPEYVIVLASKVSIKNANIFVEQLHKDGHTTTRVIKTKTGNKVVYGDYSSESQAYQALNNLRDKGEQFEEAWVYKVER